MTEPKNYVEGQHFVCPKCKMKSVVKIKHDLKNFKIVASYPVCAFCHARLDTMGVQPECNRDDRQAHKAFDRLFGDDTAADKQRQQEDEKLKESLKHTASHFCRDCRHYIHHPFLSRCELHHHSVEPMDDCPQFSPLSHKEEN